MTLSARHPQPEAKKSANLIMPSNETILKIITDEERFLRSIFSSQSCEGFEIREIPRNSFTAFRLTYTSPADISTASKTILLGGVPEYWHQEKRSRFWGVFIKLYTRKLRQSMKMLTSHGHKRIYQADCKTRGYVENSNYKKRINNSIKIELPNTKSNSKYTVFPDNDYRNFKSINVKNKPSLFRRYSTGAIGIHSLQDHLTLTYRKEFQKDGLVSNYVRNEMNNSKKKEVNIKKPDVKRFKRARNRRKKIKLIRRLKQSNNKNHQALKLLEPVAEEGLTYIASSKTLLSDTDASQKRHSNFVRRRNQGNDRLKSRKNHKITVSSHNHHNILLCDEALIMEKIGLTREGPRSTFNEDENIDTRIEEQWREYISVLVKTDDPINPLLILCYKKGRKKSIATIQNREKLPEPMMIISLNRFSEINFYSSLDKTLSIQTTSFMDKHGRETQLFNHIRIHILQFKVSTVSFRWLTILRNYFSEASPPKQFTLNLPEINISININMPLKLLKELEMIEVTESKTTKIAFLNYDLHVFQSPLLRYLRVVILKLLKMEEYNNCLKELYNINALTGCNMKTSDRIEWFPSNDVSLLKRYKLLEDTHSLEFRRMQKYPFIINDETVQRMREPTPVEGFLLKLDYIGTGQSNYLKNQSYKPCYFFTSDEFLLYTISFKGSPPLPDNITVDEEGAPVNYETQVKNFNKIPEIFEQDPYELTIDGKIKWLTPNFLDESFEKWDHYAFKCYNRKVLQILKSEGAIDLSLICEILLFESVELENNVLEFFQNAHYSFWKKNMPLQELRKCLFVIKMSNNTKIQLIAPTAIVASMWVKILNNHIKYWKRRHELDSEHLENFLTRNTSNQSLTCMQEGKINDTRERRVSTAQFVDNLLFDNNSVSLLRPMIKKGLLFQKITKHSSFRKYFVILIPGFLMLFIHNVTPRNKYSYGGYLHYETIPIEHCYLISGTSSLTNEGITINILNPGCQAVPKLFEDESISVEEDINRCFTLHFGRKSFPERSYIDDSTVEKESTFWMPNKKLSNQFVKASDPYKSMTFKAKCRSQRDLWVLSLQQELERLNSSC